jgi:hypothetical protein
MQVQNFSFLCQLLYEVLLAFFLSAILNSLRLWSDSLRFFVWLNEMVCSKTAHVFEDTAGILVQSHIVLKSPRPNATSQWLHSQVLIEHRFCGALTSQLANPSVAIHLNGVHLHLCLLL